MPSIEKRTRDGVVSWQARYRDLDGVQRKRSFRRRVDAERYLTTVQHDLLAGSYLDPRAGLITFGAWSTQWLDSLGHLKATTRERYAGLLRRHVLPKWGRRPLSSIRHADVAAWVSGMSHAGHGAGTVRQAYRVLSLVLEVAVRDGRLHRNPALKVPLPRMRRTTPRFLSPDQVVQLVQAAGPDGLSIRLLALTGLRFGELAALRVGRIDLARRRLTISESVTEVGGRLVFSSPKTHQTRTVPVPSSVIPALAAACEGRAADQLLLTSPRGGPVRINNWRRRVFDPACERAGITGVTPHDLRHTAASLAVSAGANVKAVQRMLGHASAAMTLDVYAALFDADLDAVADGLDLLVPQMCPESPISGTAVRGLEVGQAADQERRPVGQVGLEPTTDGL